MHPLLRLIRLPNCLMMGLAVIVGSSIASGGDLWSIGWERLTLGFLAGFFLTGSSMAFNDYWDREIDAINEPTRPIPSGEIGVRAALTYTVLLLLVGVIISMSINYLCLTMAAISWLISMAYTVWGKRTGLMGNLMVSMCVIAPFIYGSFIVNRMNPVSWIFISMVFLANTAREITKGIVDIEGDRAHGVKTIAVTYGARVAAIISSILYVMAVGLSFLPIIWRLTSIYYVILVIPADLGFIYSTIAILRRHDRENARKAKNRILLWMLLGLIAFLTGSIGYQ